jgi:uncharacterized protein YcbX
MSLTISQIWVYPVKSLGGIALEEAVAEPRGFRHDRRWMLVDPQGRFVTQRELPQMAMLGTSLQPPFLRVFWKNAPHILVEIPLDSENTLLTKKMVEVWGDRCRAIEMPPEINQWFSDNLKRPLRLVYMPDSTRRRTDGRYAPAGQHVSFADGFPYLIIGQASLDELNRRMADSLPMNRFRPNLVFTGGQPFEEDGWTDFRIGANEFRRVKPCARCVVTTIDQQTGQRAAEPLKTLATFRKSGNRILFGQNLIPVRTAAQPVRVGDLVVMG